MGALNWSPVMPRGVSPPDSSASDPDRSVQYLQHNAALRATLLFVLFFSCLFYVNTPSKVGLFFMNKVARIHQKKLIFFIKRIYYNTSIIHLTIEVLNTIIQLFGVNLTKMLIN